MVKEKRWGAGAAPSALGATDLGGVVGAKSRTIFSWLNDGADQHAVALPLEHTRWTYAVGLPVSTFTAAATDFLKIAALAAVVGIVLAAGIATVVGRTIVAPLSVLTEYADQFAVGNIGYQVSARRRRSLDRRDETGAIARAFEHMREYLVKMAGHADR